MRGASAPGQAGDSTTSCGCHQAGRAGAAAPGAWSRIAATATGCKAGATATAGTGAAPQCKAGSAATAARCKAGAATTGTSTQRKTGDTSTTSCAGGRRRPAGAASTGAQGMSAGQDHVGCQRPTCLQIAGKRRCRLGREVGQEGA